MSEIPVRFRIARALYEQDAARGDSGWKPWESVRDSRRGKYLERADCALAAIGSPTRTMIAAAHKHHEGAAYLPVSLFEAMIGAAQRELQISACERSDP